MCLNFSASDLEEIKLNISNLTIPSKRTDDPILGPLSDQQQLSSVFPKKHGLLIQKTLLKIIKASPGWDGVNEFKFERNNKRKDHLIDTFAFNKNLGVALFIEVKRRLGQQQASSIEKFYPITEL